MAEQEHGAAVEARIEHIADLMRRLAWATGKTGKRLAEDWGITYHRVRELAAEASKRVKAELTADQKSKLSLESQRTLLVVMRKGRKGKTKGGLNAAAAAARTAAHVAGIMAPKKFEAKIDGLAELFDELRKLEASTPTPEG